VTFLTGHPWPKHGLAGSQILIQQLDGDRRSTRSITPMESAVLYAAQVATPAFTTPHFPRQPQVDTRSASVKGPLIPLKILSRPLHPVERHHPNSKVTRRSLDASWNVVNAAPPRFSDGTRGR
jgi:hypothetical protein